MTSLYMADGIDFPTPTKISCGYEIISRSFRDANGIFRDLLVRLNRKVIWQYDVLSRDEANLIYNTINGKIVTYFSRMFNVTTDFPGFNLDNTSNTSPLTSVFYLGGTTNFDSLCATTAGNGVDYWSTKLDWVEKEGIGLSGITGLPQIHLLAKKNNIDIKNITVTIEKEAINRK